MSVRNATGRPPKMNYRVMIKLADALQHSATVSDACRYAGISRDTYYRYLKHEQVFAETIEAAKANQYKLRFSLLTEW